MKEINNINFASLKAGDKIAEINNGEVRFFEYLMVHPHNDNYVLLLDSADENAKKVYIPTFIGGGYYFDYTYQEVNQKKIEQLEARITRLKM